MEARAQDISNVRHTMKLKPLTAFILSLLPVIYYIFKLIDTAFGWYRDMETFAEFIGFLKVAVPPILIESIWVGGWIYLIRRLHVRLEVDDTDTKKKVRETIASIDKIETKILYDIEVDSEMPASDVMGHLHDIKTKLLDSLNPDRFANLKREYM